MKTVIKAFEKYSNGYEWLKNDSVTLMLRKFFNDELSSLVALDNFLVSKEPYSSTESSCSHLINIGLNFHILGLSFLLDNMKFLYFSCYKAGAHVTTSIITQNINLIKLADLEHLEWESIVPYVFESNVVNEKFLVDLALQNKVSWNAIRKYISTETYEKNITHVALSNMML